MRLNVNLSRKKRGTGSIIGAAFMLIIFMTFFTYLKLQFNVTEDYNSILKEMHQLDLKKSQEEIEFISISFTSLNLLNITVRNNGPNQAHLIWLGVFNESANKQDYYRINFFVNSAEKGSNVCNDTIPSFEGQTRVLQLVTELGNVFMYRYPEESAGEDNEERYHWVDETCDLQTPLSKGNHSFFSAQQGFPDSIVDTLTEENTAMSSTSNQTVNADLDRDDWISNQVSAGDVSSGVLSNTYLSNDIRYELVETIATGGAPSNRNYLLAWRFDFTSLPTSRTDTHVYIEAHTTGETFRVYWSPDDSTMNYLGTINSTSDSWLDWDISDDASTTIYILFKDINDVKADGTDTSVADIIRIDSLFLEITTGVVDNYELDLEVRWIGVDYDETNEWLCIYGGTMGSEDILVDVWNGSTWINILTDLSSGWNNVDVSSLLVSPTFNIRFRGGVETTDTIQDSWEIDSAYLYVWT